MQSHPAPAASIVRARRAGRPRARRIVPPAAAMRGVLVFIDPRTADLGCLATTPQAGVIALDVESDGLRQIAANLAMTPGVRAVVLAAHSMAGRVALGDTLLSTATLPRHTATLRAIGRALGPQGIVLFYGCAEAGASAFMTDLARLARVQVAVCADTLLAGTSAGPAPPEAACGWSG